VDLKAKQKAEWRRARRENGLDTLGIIYDQVARADVAERAARGEISVQQAAHELGCSLGHMEKTVIDVGKALELPSLSEQRRVKREKNIAEAKRLRASGLTQRQIAAELGVSPQVVSLWFSK
jgi:DNA invertase Pin-like site-specific DNA recombinase